MAAAGIRPQTSGMVFPCGASVQQHPPAVIANDDGNSPVPQSVLMRLKLGRRSNRDIVGVDDDHLI